ELQLRRRGADARPAWDPARDMLQVRLVCGPESSLQRRLLIEHDEDVKEDPRDGGPGEKRDRSVEHRLPDKDRRDRNVHRVAHPTVETTGHKAVRRVVWRGRAFAFDDEPGKAPREDRDP